MMNDINNSKNATLVPRIRKSQRAAGNHFEGQLSFPFCLKQTVWEMQSGGVATVWNGWQETSGTLCCAGHRMLKAITLLTFLLTSPCSQNCDLSGAADLLLLPLSLASSRAHTGRIRTCRTAERGSCLLDMSAVQSVATAHSSPMDHEWSSRYIELS